MVACRWLVKSCLRANWKMLPFNVFVLQQCSLKSWCALFNISGFQVSGLEEILRERFFWCFSIHYRTEDIKRSRLLLSCLVQTNETFLKTLIVLLVNDMMTFQKVQVQILISEKKKTIVNNSHHTRFFHFDTRLIQGNLSNFLLLQSAKKQVEMCVTHEWLRNESHFAFQLLLYVNINSIPTAKHNLFFNFNHNYTPLCASKFSYVTRNIFWFFDTVAIHTTRYPTLTTSQRSRGDSQIPSDFNRDIYVEWLPPGSSRFVNTVDCA